MKKETRTMQGVLEERRASDTTTVFGFWVYLMTDFVLFASLFSVFIVLRGNVYGGPSGSELFEMPMVLAETLILLTSSLTCGLMLISARAGSVRAVVSWLAATALLGVAFVAIEVFEFLTLVREGNGPSRSAFLSAFFTLVGTHGLHVIAGIMWIIALVAAILRTRLKGDTMRKLLLFAMFWHFLDVIWIFIFTIVYLIGTI